ncbi:MAG: hypothetical protein KAS19_09405 [Anaerolineales bacterium]|nr:hypothetical protein [Anaerolineales bacterium]
MTKQEFIDIRIAELTARRDYAKNLVMNRDMAHEVKICDAQIKALNELGLLEVAQSVLPKIGPLVQFWTNNQDPAQLMYTDDHGHDTVLCENHLTDPLIKCSNCIKPWPVNK